MLYRNGSAPVIVVTGGRMEGDTYTEATSGYNWLRARDVPDEAILKEVQGRSTFESLSATARFLDERDLDEVILVSDGYHALRVQGIARRGRADPARLGRLVGRRVDHPDGPGDRSPWASAASPATAA